MLREESEAVGAGGGVGAVQVWGDVSAEAKDLVRSMMTVTAHAAATRRRRRTATHARGRRRLVQATPRHGQQSSGARRPPHT